MRISATGDFSVAPPVVRRSARRGFTLVELLVVLVILAISIGLVTVNLSRDQGTKLEEDARRLALLLQFARDQAIAGGQSLAWAARDGGYLFMRRDGSRGWIAARDGEALTPREWPANVALSRLRVAGTSVPVTEPLVFSASGMNLPYEMELASGTWRVAISGGAAGKVSVARASEAAAAQ